jgi:radical SAM protein with 4Fe4S-binding SPASM domain
MNKIKLRKAIKRVRNLPRNKYLFLYLSNKLKHFAFRLTKSTKAAYPSTIMLELNNHCNLHCTTCPREYAYGQQMDKGYITLDQAKKVVDELWPYLDSIGLTGMGETFLFKEMEQIVDYIKAKNKGIIITLSTNAMLPDFIALAAKVIGKVDILHISIDGLGETYEKIRKGADFKTFDQNVAELARLCRGTETALSLDMVVTKENYHQLPDMIPYCAEKGVKGFYHTTYNLGSVTGTEAGYYQFYHSPEFTAEMRNLQRAGKKHPEVVVTSWDYKGRSGFKKCFFPWGYFYICWNGFVTPCCAKPFPKELNFGNVFAQGVMAVLNGREFRSFRARWQKNQTPDFCRKCHFIDLGPIG